MSICLVLCRVDAERFQPYMTLKSMKLLPWPRVFHSGISLWGKRRQPQVPPEVKSQSVICNIFWATWGSQDANLCHGSAGVIK